MDAQQREIEDQFGRLQRLIKRGDLAAIRRELDAGLSPNFENRNGWTMLMLAASEGNTALAELLLSAGADVNRLTTADAPHPGQSAMSLAVVHGHVRFIQMLLEHGANPDSPPNGTAAENWIPASQADSKTRKTMLSLIRAHRAKHSP